MADIVDVARCNDVPNLGFTLLTEKPVLPIESVSGSFYLRAPVQDKAGVMAKLGAVLSNHNVSIEALIQKDARRSGDAQVVIVTNEVVEADIRAAIEELEQLDTVTDRISMIRLFAA